MVTDHFTDEYVDTLVAYLVDTTDPDLIIPDLIVIFGSRARGDHQPWSDMDLLIVDPDTPLDVNARFRQKLRLHEGRPRRRGCDIDIHICTPARLDYCRGAINHVLGRAQTDGRVLYARSS